MFKTILAIFLTALSVPSLAQTYPTKPIILIVPFSAGGPTDVVARQLASAMGKNLKQTIVVENRASAGGIVGSNFVSRAQPDGYTLLIHNIGMSTLPALSKNLEFNPLKDFSYIGQVVDVPMTLVGKKELPPDSFKDLKSYLHINQKSVNLANAGVGTASHLCGLLLMTRLELPLTTVSYKGAAPAMGDLMGGHVDLLCDQITTTQQPIVNKKVKAYGATSSVRLPMLAQLATLGEQGLNDFELTVWHGIYAPKDLPKNISDRLVKALQTALGDPVFQETMGRLGALPVTMDKASPAGLSTHLQQQILLWTPIIEKSNAYLQ
jgi:tripartite-type tricarboxylate transporter receptor subunit TctC